MAETILPEIESAFNPITALAFLPLATLSNPYLLAGEGQFLKVFEHQTRRLIRAERIFDSQAIHGIVCQSLPRGAGNGGTLLVWGGRSICLVSVGLDLDENGDALVKVVRHVPEVLWDDRILDGCFRPTNDTDRASGSNIIEAILVTAHNDLIWLRFEPGNAEARANRWLYRVASGPSSILYSAHTLWEDAGQRLLVAAGTVFGEVLLWSLDLDRSASSEVCLHYRFTGHEGSVFGVRISDVAQTGAVERILASCSDDRTIRIWNISDISSNGGVKRFGDEEPYKSEASLLEGTNEADSTGSLAMIMAQGSRIWGLRFLIQKDGCWDLMSYGEDSTAQAWRASPLTGQVRMIGTPHSQTYQLSHQRTYSYHSGKNLWAMAVCQKAQEECIVATGGADGRITTYEPLLQTLLQRVPARTAAWTSQYTMDEVSTALQTTSSETVKTQTRTAQSSMGEVFRSLKGSWKLIRNLNSLVSTYPSGTLEGIATFAERHPTEDIYDAEYLYSESGDFTTQQGLTLRATRQYVYRYSRTTDAISVWFVKPDDGGVVDYFFHKLDFREMVQRLDPGPEIWSASGYHLCVEDNYNADYSFHLKDSKITNWHAVFNVNGPKKDYVASAMYTRDRQEHIESEDREHVNPPSTKKNRSTLDSQKRKHRLDAFKTYSWISENEVLTTTERGNLLIGTISSNVEESNLDGSPNVIWEHVGHQKSLSSSCIATTIPSLGVALLTGTDGIIILYNRRSREVDAISKLPGKAGFLRAQTLSESWNSWLQSRDQGEKVGVLASCIGSSRATVSIISAEIHADSQLTEEEAGLSAIHTYHITLQSQFIVTSSCFLDTEYWIILGSRNGDIAIYDLAQTTPNLALGVTPSCFQNVHGEDAITMVRTVSSDVSKTISRIAIVTTGRDGRWAIHQVYHEAENGTPFVCLQTIHVGAPPFGPNIEGTCVDSTSKDLLLWGFRSKQFVVWNESQKTEVMAVDCGGAHRNLAYIYNQGGSGGGSFVYTKASVCHVHSQTQASHQVIQHGGHGREIKAMALSPAIKMSNDNDDAKLRLVATGAEDTAIRIFDLNASLKCLSIITKHTTGIQQLRWTSDGQRLFSAAGCEEFFVWHLQSAPLVTIGVVCEAQCPSVTEEVDLRIMDFATEEIGSHHHDLDDGVACGPDYLLSMVYSDSSVRVFRYHTTSSTTQKNTFQLLTEGSYTTHCLTQAVHLHTSEGLRVLCTASTDGHLALWPLSLDPLISGHDNDNDLPTTRPPPLHYTTRTAIHQSSIKALDHATLSPSEKLIVTGGDDGAIALTRVKIHKPSDALSETTTLLLPNAHASAVTAVVFLGNNNNNNNNNNKPNQAKENKHENRKRSFALASVGNDQRLKTWNVSIDGDPVETQGAKGGIELSGVADVYSSVADAGALGTFSDGVDDDDGDGGRRQCWVLVAGIGVERWRVGGGLGRG